MAQEDPVLNLTSVTRRMIRPLTELLTATDPATFDRLFSTVESDIVAWKDAFSAIDKTNVQQMDVAISVAQSVLPMLGRIHQKSVDLGATKGQKMTVAPAAGGFKFPRKMSRKYCKKTPCKKMGFTQRSSCRPYKKCSTRKPRRKGY